MAGARSMLDTIVTWKLSFLVSPSVRCFVAFQSQVACTRADHRHDVPAGHSIRFTVAYSSSRCCSPQGLSRMGNEMVTVQYWMAEPGIGSIAIFSIL
jgi:hypothetical protein